MFHNIEEYENYSWDLQPVEVNYDLLYKQIRALFYIGNGESDKYVLILCPENL